MADTVENIVETALDTAEDLIVCLDFNDLGSYLALAPTCLLINDCGLSVKWLPLSSEISLSPTRVVRDTTEVVSDDPLVALKARRARARARYAAQELSRCCSLLGISAADAERAMDPALANLGLMYMTQTGEGDPAVYAACIYRALYSQGPLPDAIDSVAAALAAAGVDVALQTLAVELEHLRPQLIALQAALLEQGMFSSPGYLLRGERFLGRQHLPLLRWYAGGEQGPPPV